ncbi:GNAT family N-acetyltransferase [Montanilutibacter psychrotolerans]|uniref:GNAT family N-acetyltransferase n=1 Tax=Montanilutibacter psychrotolerans TaxID=1327343 RepID=A0A3M8SRZ7_9GAMM|nr:GNAT family N-acetyltransferase [Lysobacter psychrotolerans]RNF84118.1 GNAT family N-acetyltransferase [Lysobacter psychrotolerans]
MDLAIHRATLADLDTLAPMFDAYRVFYQQPSDLPRAHAFLHERLQTETSVVLLATLHGQSAGFTQLYPAYSSVRTARTWVLNDLFVERTARRQGVARALLEAGAHYAGESGAAGISLETSRDNTPARALYRGAGWHEDNSQWYSLAFPPS